MIIHDNRRFNGVIEFSVNCKLFVKDDEPLRIWLYEDKVPSVQKVNACLDLLFGPGVYESGNHTRSPTYGFYLDIRRVPK